ncbi:uncharacterized protein N7498_003342 [Penicillium cinerascens]|uniref:Grh/CP2 DB domain-containing protein n=1 Tax=Penicillium cinerascens TaxID=70096 RepID=A0A9W9N229_9EURO|nr:uncharacterized protein N7498_003342 [Penicillium cinerascens]KAJ5211696.1 hypothetical protein N7498_003342 [Penicillium cinerascens]
MFRNRNNAQKPDEEFIGRFQRTFSDIVPRRDGEGDPNGGFMMNGKPMGDMKMEESDMKFPHDRTPRNLQDLNFTSSWVDPSAMPMMPLASQYPGFYTPNSGGMGAIFHNQAGDLHTPTAGMNMITPLSLSNPMPAPPNQASIDQFNQQYLGQSVEMNPFVQPASYAPSAFLNSRESGYEAMDESGDSSSLNEFPVDEASTISTSTEFSSVSGMPYSQGEKFRYNVTLRAPTAMVKHKREIPVTYLNKGQAYNLTVTDSSPPIVTTEPIRYRTFVRVSFEEDEQKFKPASCWQLWKEGRGINEAHQRGGKLQAVEYVDPIQGGDDHKSRQIQVESMSFDGFCVTWTANPLTGASDCTIPVRFNFLSTDFSHSKGVKGIPVRLCHKTELLSPGEETGASREAEVAYCRVKLFRDHGAERKLSNDVAHVKKTIEKLKQQIAQAEMGGGFGKRKRGSQAAPTMKGSDRNMKALKNKRTWSIGSQDQPEKLSLEDDLQSKLAMMQDMFSSTRAVSALALRGDEHDDPDLYPVRLPTDGDSANMESLNRQNTGASQSMESLILSPTSSNISLDSPRMNGRQMPGKESKKPTAISRVLDDSRTGYIEAIDIDPTYRPPAERPPKPIACFYIRFGGTEQQPYDYYRAIYLTERTVRDLMKKISEKHHIDPSRIVRVLHVNHNGMRIMVDDDVVRELPEGQDMVADIYEADAGCNGTHSPPMEIKLTY